MSGDNEMDHLNHVRKDEIWAFLERKKKMRQQRRKLRSENNQQQVSAANLIKMLLKMLKKHFFRIPNVHLMSFCTTIPKPLTILPYIN